VYRDGAPHILKDLEGTSVTDSLVGIDPDDRQLKVGTKVRGFLERDPGNSAKEIKRCMYKQNYTVELGGKQHSPSEISSMILKYLKNSAQKRLDEEVERCVITIPANFPDPARRATRQAGEIAGMEVERIINEPTAAALAYGHREMIEDENIMIYDLGGGTFDVSIVEQVGPVLDVKASFGDRRLGGADFDRALLNHVIERLEAEHGVEGPAEETGAWYNLLHKCEEAKKVLSSQQEASVEYRGFTNTVDIHRSTFEDLITPMVDETESSIRHALEEAGLDRGEVDRVILVGGSTRIPYVQQLVEGVMGQMPRSTIDPDKAVALGAANQAAIIDGSADGIIMDLCAQSFGTAVVDARTGQTGRYDVIIPENGEYQKEYTETYRTIVEDQEVIDFRVYQRDTGVEMERAEVEGKSNDGFTLIGKQEVEVPKGPAGQKVEATYKYTLDGTLDIKLNFPRTGAKREFRTRAEVDEEQIERSRAKVENTWKESKYLDDVEALMDAAERELEKDDLGAQKKQEVKELLRNLKEALAAEEESEIRGLEDDLTDLLFELDL
jgi:molecular chaperone DnaK